MVKRLLLIALFAVTSLFAQNGVPSTELPKSRFVAQTEFYYSKLSIFRESLTFNGNGDFWLQFGREFRFARYFSWTPSFGFNRNGWSFERAGHQIYLKMIRGSKVLLTLRNPCNYIPEKPICIIFRGRIPVDFNP